MRLPRWLTVPAVAFLSTALFAALLVLAPVTPAAANESCSVVVSGGEASLSWAPVDGVSTYVVRSMKPGESFKWRVTLSDEFSWTNVGHVSGEEYLIRYQPGPTDIPCTEDGGEPPTPPADGCSVVVSGGEASLSWAPVDGVSTYVVRSMKPGESFKWRVTLSDEFSWTNVGHVSGEEYLIRYQPGPTDIPCTEDGGEPPTPPADGCSVVVSGGEASLSWAPVDGVSTYVVRSMKPGESFKWRVTLSDEFSWTNVGHVSGEEYLIRYQPGPTDIPCVDDVVSPDNCVALQSGIPVIQSGAHYGGLISSDDAVWPAEAAHAASGGNVLYGYMWVPENWQINADGYHSLLHTGGTNFWAKLDRQLDGTGTGGIVGYKLEGTRHRVLDGRQLNGHSPRGEFPTLSHLPETVDEHGGRFELVGLNIWRYGQYQYEATFTTSPRSEIPNAPYVEQPCYVYDDIVPGYGPNYNENFWTKLNLTEETAARLLFIWTNPVEAARFGQEALVYVEEVLQGCVAAVAEFFESILEAAQLVEEFFRNPELFINTKIEEIRVAVEAAVADPENAVTEAVRQVLKLDLLAENPARWVGEVGCQILIDIVTGVAVAKVAERVLDFINAKRRDVGDNDPDARDPDVQPRDLEEQRNYEEDSAEITVCANSFAAGTQVRLADGSVAAIESLAAQDAVVTLDLETGLFTTGTVARHWSAYEEGLHRVSFGGDAIFSTPDHRFLLADGAQWLSAATLTDGGSVRSFDGSVSVVSSVTVSDELGEVWDITVEPHNNFVVSDGTNDVVVHNADCETLVPATPEHKAARWEAYQERGGQWAEEHWSAVYDANMTRAARARERSDAAAEVRGLGAHTEFPAGDLLPGGRFDTGRRWDFADPDGLAGFEHKSGDVVYNTQEVSLQANKDGVILGANPDWSVTWTFDGRPSKPLWDLLDGLGIGMEDAATQLPISRPGE